MNLMVLKLARRLHSTIVSTRSIRITKTASNEKSKMKKKTFYDSKTTVWRDGACWLKFWVRIRLSALGGQILGKLRKTSECPIFYCWYDARGVLKRVFYCLANAIV